MKSTAPLPKMLLPAPPELALKSYEGTPGYGEVSPPSEEQATADAQVSADAQASGDLARPNARYTGGNVYDFINAQPTL